uniref:HSF-type DNA-binding domain-containing protein n=1 Tax=Gouania willdenowi TaxID=441366 RepID=A0A8C5G5B6_GOUWI
SKQHNFLKPTFLQNFLQKQCQEYGIIFVINQCLFEKEISDKHFKSFHRQLNIYGFKTFWSKTLMAGYRCFQNPNFKRDHPELLYKMTRKQVRNRVKAVDNQKKTQELPDQNQHGGEGSNTTCSSDQPAVHYQLGQYLPDFHQQHLEYYTRTFCHTGLYQSVTPGETSELTLEDSDEDILLKMANELLEQI